MCAVPQREKNCDAPWETARLGVRRVGRVRRKRAVGDQSGRRSEKWMQLAAGAWRKSRRGKSIAKQSVGWEGEKKRQVGG
jgi:hypothetical protein